MSASFRVGDDATITYPVTDSTGGDVDWADPTVRANDTVLQAEWVGPPAPTRDITIPLGTLPVGSYHLWLVIPGGTDIRLGSIYIVPAAPAVQVPDYGGCLWPVDPGCFDDEWHGLDAMVQERSLALASSTLRRLTGYRVGGCPITVRPAPQRGSCFVPYMGPQGALFRPGIDRSGAWVNNCGWCESEVCGIKLPAPVGRIDSVKIDGVVIPPTDYRIDNGNELVWMGVEPCPFYEVQDMSLPDTEVGTFSVTYLNAYPVDSLGAYAAGVLAMEFARACSGSDECRLPPNVTSIVRQGVSMNLVSGVFPEGRTGIHEVDSFIALWNPRGQQPSTVWSPDRRKFRTTSGGTP